MVAKKRIEFTEDANGCFNVTSHAQIKVQEIRSLLDKGQTLKIIAQKFGVTESTIWRVKVGECWGKAKETKAHEEKESSPNLQTGKEFHSLAQ